MKNEKSVSNNDNSNRILCFTGTRICLPVDRPISRSSETFITNTTDERRLMWTEKCLTQADRGYTPLWNWKVTELQILAITCFIEMWRNVLELGALIGSHRTFEISTWEKKQLRYRHQKVVFWVAVTDHSLGTIIMSIGYAGLIWKVAGRTVLWLFLANIPEGLGRTMYFVFFELIN
jgi:hypothetical protein